MGSLVAALVGRLRRRTTGDQAGADQVITDGRTADKANRPPALAVALVVAIVLAAAAGGAAWYGHREAEQRDTAVRQALAAATPAAKAIFSYDYRNFDASVANGRTFVTGKFADEYAQTTSALKATAVSGQAVVTAEVSAAGVVTASGDQVELLLYLNQYRRNVNTAGEKVDQNRVVLDLVPVNGEWKVSSATAI
jgi:Mce-associated membrane protein